METNDKGFTKSALLVGMFAATALAVSTGCSSSQPTYSAQDVCQDDDDNGYCDNDNSDVDSSHFIYIGGHKTYYKKGHYNSGSSSYGSSNSGGSTSTGKPGTSTNGTTTNKGSSVAPPSSSSGTGSVIGRGSSGSVSSGKSGVGSSSGSSSS